MRIDGEWWACDDGFVRPIIRGAVLDVDAIWKPATFLVDTGADCTVLSASMLELLRFDTGEPDEQLGGVGGNADSLQVKTQIRLNRADGGNVVFRSQYSAVTQVESLDMSILGRDILNLFSVIVDRPANIIALIRPPDRYVIQTD